MLKYMYRRAVKEEKAMGLLKKTDGWMCSNRCVFLSDFSSFPSCVKPLVFYSSIFKLTQVTMLEDDTENHAEMCAISDSHAIWIQSDAKCNIPNYAMSEIPSDTKHNIPNHTKHNIPSHTMIESHSHENSKIESHEKSESHSHENDDSHSLEKLESHSHENGEIERHEKSENHSNENDENVFDLACSGMDQCYTDGFMDQVDAKKDTIIQSSSIVGHRNVDGSQVQDGTSIMMRAVSWHGVYSDIEFVQ